MKRNKTIYILILSLIFNIYLIFDNSRNLDKINYLENNITDLEKNIRNLEKNDYRSVLYSWKEYDYVNTNKYDNKTDYWNYVQLENKIYKDIQDKHEMNLFKRGIIKLNISILGSKDHGDNPVRTLEKIPVYLADSVEDSYESNGWSNKGYQFSYDIESHTIYLQIDYFRLQQNLMEPPVFIDGYQEDKWTCNGNECVNNGTWFITYINQSMYVK